jgi:hypothetical protein
VLIVVPKVLKILGLRTDELLHQNGLSLKELAFEGSSENKHLLEIGRKTQRDSRTMRVATTVATFYLPASLVAVST